jgi:hypothetical protein
MVAARPMVRLGGRGEQAGQRDGKAECGGAFHHAANRRGLRHHFWLSELVKSKHLE